MSSKFFISAWPPVMLRILPVKVLCLIITLCAYASAASTASESPGNAAIQFLQKIRERKVDLQPGADTAISAHVSAQKRQQVEARLKRMISDLGAEKLELGREKIDGDFAGVLVWKTDGYDPIQMQVFAVAMIRRNDNWLPAPVPASFENCGIGYPAEIRKRIEALETWMLQGKVEDLSKLRSEAIVRMQQNIEKHITRKALSELKPNEVMNRFLKACKNRNGYEILGLIGGLSETLPENWTLRATSIDAATAPDQTEGPWRLLMSPNVLRATVDTDDEYGPLQTSIACLDPQSVTQSAKKATQIELVHLRVEQSPNGLWQVEVPDSFWQDQDDATTLTSEELDRDLLDRFAKEIRKDIPNKPLPTAAAARDSLIAALHHGSFHELLELTSIPEDPALGRMAITHAAEIWGSIHGLASTQNPASAYQVLAVDMNAKNDTAAVLYHVFSARKPDRFDPAALYLKKTENGWLWTPDPTDQIQESFRNWVTEQATDWKSRWRPLLLSNCPVVDQLPAGPAPTEEQAKAVVSSWFKAIEAGDVEQALAQCAMLKFADSPVILLRNLGYEMVDALRKDGRGSICHVMQDGPWTAVGANPRNAEAPTYILYPVISTPVGPRILLEIDLIASSGRGREFLNRSNLNRLQNFDVDAAKALEGLFTKHGKQSLGEDKDR